MTVAQGLRNVRHGMNQGFVIHDCCEETEQFPVKCTVLLLIRVELLTKKCKGLPNAIYKLFVYNTQSAV